jgi:hypothetical protein
MRNWHHKAIKLDEALPFVSANDRMVVGVMEGLIEWEPVTPDLHGLNYKAKSPSLFKVISRDVLPAPRSVSKKCSALRTSPTSQPFNLPQ